MLLLIMPYLGPSRSFNHVGVGQVHLVFLVFFEHSSECLGVVV